jgi:sporulation protein YlmC with PRC-barrel domain
LNDTDLILADAGQDIRNRKVIDRHGGAIGHVSDLFIDRDERKVRMLEIRAGGFLGLGDRHFLLPVDVITNVAKDEVRVNETRERIENSPSYDPKLLAAQAPEHWEPCYGYYGLSPFWGAGYVYPEFPKSAERPVTD